MIAGVGARVAGVDAGFESLVGHDVLLRSNVEKQETNATGGGPNCVMNGSMDSMMGGVMGLAWLPMLAGLALLIALIVVVVKLLSSASPERTAAKVILGVLAVIGGVALVAALAMGTMHLGMRCC